MDRLRSAMKPSTQDEKVLQKVRSAVRIAEPSEASSTSVAVSRVNFHMTSISAVITTLTISTLFRTRCSVHASDTSARNFSQRNALNVQQSFQSMTAAGKRISPIMIPRSTNFSSYASRFR